MFMFIYIIKMFIDTYIYVIFSSIKIISLYK